MNTGETFDKFYAAMLERYNGNFCNINNVCTLSIIDHITEATRASLSGPASGVIIGMDKQSNAFISILASYCDGDSKQFAHVVRFKNVNFMKAEVYCKTSDNVELVYPKNEDSPFNDGTYYMFLPRSIFKQVLPNHWILSIPNGSPRFSFTDVADSIVYKQPHSVLAPFGSEPDYFALFMNYARYALVMKELPEKFSNTVKEHLLRRVSIGQAIFASTDDRYLLTQLNEFLPSCGENAYLGSPKLLCDSLSNPTLCIIGDSSAPIIFDDVCKMLRFVPNTAMFGNSNVLHTSSTIRILVQYILRDFLRVSPTSMPDYLSSFSTGIAHAGMPPGYPYINAAPNTYAAPQPTYGYNPNNHVSGTIVPNATDKFHNTREN